MTATIRAHSSLSSAQAEGVRELLKQAMFLEEAVADVAMLGMTGEVPGYGTKVGQALEIRIALILEAISDLYACGLLSSEKLRRILEAVRAGRSA